MIFEIFPILFSLISPYKYILLVIGILYLFYYKKYGFYLFKQKEQFTVGKLIIGRTLPPHPNGWFVLTRSNEIAKGESKYIDIHGESLAVFRGTNGTVYAISAYCPHLGTNLGVGGEVTNESCIKCPFHGWTFDGETGNCVIGKEKRPKEGIKYEYEFDEKTEEFTY